MTGAGWHRDGDQWVLQGERGIEQVRGAEPPDGRRRNAVFMHDLMKRRGLTYQHVAGLCRVSIHTVRAWMKPSSSRSSAGAPDMAVDLLCLKLGEPVPAWWEDPG